MADHLRSGHLGAQSCEDVSGETPRTTSRTAARRPELRGCLRRNGPDHLANGVSEPSFARMSQAKRSIPDNSETRVVRMSQAKRPKSQDFVEDLSRCPPLGRNKLLSQQHPSQHKLFGEKGESS